MFLTRNCRFKSPARKVLTRFPIGKKAADFFLDRSTIS